MAMLVTKSEWTWNGLNLKWPLQPEMALNSNIFNLKWPIANLKWPQPEMALTWNGQIQPEMAPTWNGPNLKWPNLKWPTWNGQPEMAQPEVGYTPLRTLFDSMQHQWLKYEQSSDTTMFSSDTTMFVCVRIFVEFVFQSYRVLYTCFYSSSTDVPESR